MSRREDRTQRRVTVVRHTRPPAAGRFARRPGHRPEGWRAKLPAALQRPLAWQAPVAGRAVAGAGKAARRGLGATRSLRDRLRRSMPQTLGGRLLLAVAAIALFTGATWTTTRSALLDVDRVEVSGTSVVTAAEAATGAGLHRGQPMVSVNTAAAERHLRGLPWVDTAVVERAFPNTVRIHLTERVAAAIAARPAGGWVLLDRGGRVLAERSDRTAGLPEVIGAGATPVPGTNLITARPALDVVSALPEPLRRQVQSVTLDGESVALQMGAREIRFGPPTQVAAKMAALSVLLERVGGRSVAVLDVRVPQAPVVVPTASTPATSTPAPGRGATAPANPGKPKD
ncbi:MAG TPA: FtsQ-type POTRA domain-containing protein [Acidimicrobiia bacterium]|nr:FtsQ-type POTRA domain-containing protein [Acidimicrobiia bacterium]